jgi:mono/diheme cytochrome c family protein
VENEYDNGIVKRLLVTSRIGEKVMPNASRLFDSGRHCCMYLGLALIVGLCSSGMSLAEPPKPVLGLDFGTEETKRLHYAGALQRDVVGPRPPAFPDFPEHNTSIKLFGDGARVALDDAGDRSLFDFTNGDTISIEAWVFMEQLGDKENRYVIGKGRTHREGFDRDNQNWGLRVYGKKGKVGISFLFATSHKSGETKNANAHWHRWNSSDGFVPETGWHHIAVSYQFGDPQSIRGWIDGLETTGSWDMGGPTSDPPVVDDDQVWVGASMGGNSSTSFRGSLDSIALYREALTAEFIKSRYRRIGPVTMTAAVPEVMPTLDSLPQGQVTFAVHESLPAHNRWLNDGESIGPAALQWTDHQFFLHRMPFRYDETGVRDGWKTPLLLRMAADVSLPVGKNKLLVRARGLSRLWLDGKIIARTGVLTGSTDGHQPVKPIAKPPLPGLQPAGYEMQEVIEEVEILQADSHRLILESIVGGKKFRAVPGETCVALQTADGSSYVLMQPSQSTVEPLHLTDSSMQAVATRTEARLRDLETVTRRANGASLNAYWENRHAFAKQYAAIQEIPQPKSNATHPIDAFIQDKISQAKRDAQQIPSVDAKHFQSKILPILNEHCIRCHGKKESGGLRLDDRVRAMNGGDSGDKAIVPGKAAESHMMQRILSKDPDEKMPPGETRVSDEQIALLNAWITMGAPWSLQLPEPEQLEPADLINDEAFLRRVTLDTIGIPPTPEEIRSFLSDTSRGKRAKVVERLLDDPRWADHWVSYWQEVLAENPNMLKPSLNNSGPFRWFLHESLVDNKPIDRMVTELVMLKGSEREGGAAGFGLAADNDAPFAAKAHILGTAFLGVELQCARCHDSPYHSSTQRDLYSLAAMMERKSVKVPVTSRVPAGFFEKKDRESLIKVTLPPNELIEPQFPFQEMLDQGAAQNLDQLMQNPDDPRERLAVTITTPFNSRFARVIVNRVWRRMIGAGFVEPPHDWEGQIVSHPELLDWLAAQFIVSGYDLKALSRWILTSEVYQREALGTNLQADAPVRFFASPDRRKLTAEQVVDSMFAASGLAMDVEEFTFDPEGRRAPDVMISLGRPSRAWMLASVSNERDRPSLSLPKAQAIIDVLEAFGWSGSRQNPRTDRESSPNVLQSGVLANSVVSTWVTRASNRSMLAELALQANSPESLVDTIFLRFLGRSPRSNERAIFTPSIARGFSTRRIPEAQVIQPTAPVPLPPVTWSNHLVDEANAIQLQVERRARAGAPPDPRIQPEWREAFEDMVWSVMNTREFVWVP